MRTLLAAALLLTLLSTTARAQERAFSDWIGVLEPHLTGTGFDQSAQADPGFDWRHERQFNVLLDENGTPANPFNIPGGVALTMAATYYALESGDFSVTLGELEASGWWPYDSIPADIDRAQLVTQQNGRRVLDKYRDLKHIGSANWIVQRKREVLSDFYTDFFFRPLLVQSGGGAHQEPQPAVPAVERLLPQRMNQFWVNPCTGAPMQLSENPGDLRLEDISFMAQNVREAPRPDGSFTGIGGVYSSGNEKREPLMLPVINWEYEPETPHSARSADSPAALPGWVADVSADPSRREAYKQQLKQFMPPPNEYGGQQGIVLDSSGERAPLEELRCPQALQLAASYYALATLDMQVSLRDIVVAGFWPYDTLPTWLDLSETLYDFPRAEELSLSFGTRGSYAGDPPGEYWRGTLESEIASPQWLLWRKAEILNMVHTELYFNPQRDFMPADGVDPQAQPVLPPFAAFWGNPVGTAAAGKAVEFSYGRMYGQLSTIDVNLLRPLYEGARLRYDQQVPLINLADKVDPASGEQGMLAYRQRTVDIGGVEQSRIWRLPIPGDGEYAELRWAFPSGGTKREELLLDIGWPDLTYSAANGSFKPQRLGMVYTYRQGDRMQEVAMGGFQAMATGRGAQLIYDGVAPLVKRYGLSWDEPRDYQEVRQMLGISGLAQLPGGRAGVDELAEVEELTLAGR